MNTGALIRRIFDTQVVPFLYSRVIRYDNRRRTQPNAFTNRPLAAEEIILEVMLSNVFATIAEQNAD